ncbi:D-allose ABC transporter permease [Gammaproteobacteria bacterium]|nr:D-allose ABC transporter permease [Gammaproteobacteria bacterium]
MSNFDAKQFIDISKILKSREFGLFLILLLVIIATTIANPRFLNAQNIRDILLNVSIIALLTVGMTVVILMRHIDLSIGAIVGLSAFMVGELLIKFPDMPIILALLAGVLIGFVGGTINGLLVTLGRVPSLVATLSTLYIFRGFGYAWVSGRQITASNLSSSFSQLATDDIFGLPYLTLIAFGFMSIMAIYLRNYSGGRAFYAIGSNPDAARLAGIAVTRTTLTGFMICGMIAGLAGVLWLARFGTVDASAGSGLELQVVAAAVVGSVAIGGGSGTVIGAVLGALLLSVISSSLVIMRISGFWQLAIQGGLIVSAIGLDAWLSRRLKSMTFKKAILLKESVIKDNALKNKVLKGAI